MSNFEIVGMIYIFLSFFFFFFFFLWLSGLTHYFSVCVLSGAFFSSYYFCLLFFLHLSLTFFLGIFFMVTYQQLVRLHSVDAHFKAQ